MKAKDCRIMLTVGAFALLASCGDGQADTATATLSASSPTPAPTPTPSSSPAAVAPTITEQPRDTTAAAGHPVTLSATASGTDLTYQWKRNGDVLAGARSSSLTFSPTLADDQARFVVEVTNSAGTLTSRTARLGVLSLTPVPVTYTTFDGDTATLYAWEGRRTAVLTASQDRSFATMAAILGATDATYDYYQTTTGYTPNREKVYNGKGTIAEVPSLRCGAACGYLGATGIEMQTRYFGWLYDGVNNGRRFDQTVFYEFGRNFWFLGSRLAYKTPDVDPVTTGFAVAMRFTAMEAIGVDGAPFNQSVAFPEFRARVEGLIDTYAADPTQTFDNTLRVNRAPPNPYGLSASDLFASICLRLRRDYGKETFVARLWVEAGRRPIAATTQDAVDNFVIAASTAANRNLVPIFVDRWRWPVSTTARNAVAGLPAA